MAYFFADTFDCYAAPADAIAGYWDTGGVAASLVTGRFSGSRAWQNATISPTTATLQKSSGSNDAVHHISVAIQQTGPLSGTNNWNWFTLLDGGTAQCSIVFRSDGAILLQSGASNGTTLATYTGAITAINTWYQFEIEVVINNTTGSVAIRKNGNTSNDFSLGSLNTRAGTANNYANRITLGNATTGNSQQIDDLIWRSDASSVPWLGDVRGWARMPVSDASVQWTPSSAALPYVPFGGSTLANTINTVSRFTPFTSPISGAIGTVSIPLGAANSGNFKCSIFSNFGSGPGTPLGSATVLTNLPSGTNTFTFPTPVSVTAGTQYWVGFITDTNVATCWTSTASASTGQQQSATTYAAFPVTNPATTATAAIICTLNISATGNPNTAMVQEAQQDGATSYVYSSTVGQSDRYGIAPISGTPSSVVAVVTRAYVQKSDAGTRNVAVQLQSGATNVQSASTALNTTWAWVSRTDLVDPATGAPWTAVGVANATIGCVVTA